MWFRLLGVGGGGVGGWELEDETERNLQKSRSTEVEVLEMVGDPDGF